METVHINMHTTRHKSTVLIVDVILSIALHSLPYSLHFHTIYTFGHITETYNKNLTLDQNRYSTTVIYM